MPTHSTPRRPVRNHAARVADLRSLHDDGELVYVETTKTGRGEREYVIQYGGQERRLPATRVDWFLDGFCLRGGIKPRGMDADRQTPPRDGGTLHP